MRCDSLWLQPPAGPPLGSVSALHGGHRELPEIVLPSKALCTRSINALDAVREAG